MNVVIYAPYSSHSQTEQSIEGQLHTCYEYAKTTAISLLDNILTAPRAEPPIFAPSFSG